MQNVTFKSRSAEIFFTDRTKYLHWTWGLTIDSRINISQVLTPSSPECYNTEVILFTRCLHSEIHYIYILYFTAISDNLGKVEAYSGAVFVSNRVGSFMKASEEKDRNTFLVWRNIACKTDNQITHVCSYNVLDSRVQQGYGIRRTTSTPWQKKNTNKWQHHWLIRGITLSYPNSICLVTDLRPAEEPREPGAEFRDEGLGTTGGRLMSCRELFIRCKADGSDSPLCAVSCENSLPLFGRLDWRLEEDWRRSSRGGVSRAWPTDARQI